MVVGVEKSRGPVAILDWGNGQTKHDMPTNIFSQGRKKPLSRGAKSLDIFSQGRKKPAKNQPIQSSVATGRV